MKQLFIAVTMLTLSCHALAQTANNDHLPINKLSPTNDSIKKGTTIRICAPRRGQLLKPVLLVFYWRDKLLMKPDTLMAINSIMDKLDPQLIKSVDVMNRPEGILKYGDLAKNGTIVIHLKDERKFKSKKMFKEALAEAKKQSVKKI